MIVEELFAKLGIDVDESGISRAAAALGSLRGGMLALGGAAAGIGVALAAMIKTTANYGDSINKTAQKTGTATDTLQALAYAGELADVSLEGLQGSLNYLARKGSKDPIAKFREAADAIKALYDAGKQSEAPKIAIEKLGRSGAQLIPLLKGGAEAFGEAMDEAKQFGLILDQDTLDASEALNDELTRVVASIRGLVYAIAAPLLVPLRQVAYLFAKWVATNRELISSKVHQFLNFLGLAFKQLWRLAQPVVAVIKFLTTNVWALRAAAIALALVLIGQIGAALSAFAAGMSLANVELLAMIGNQLKASAIGLLWIVTLAALVLIIEDIYGFFTGKDSLVGRWSEWVSAFAESKAGDHWLIRVLKTMLEYVTNIQHAWMDFVNALNSKNIFQRFATGGLVGAFMGGGASIGGGAASPAASVMDQTGRDAAGKFLGPVTINQTLSPTQPADMTGPEFAKAVADQSSDNFQRELSQAAWGVQW